MSDRASRYYPPRAPWYRSLREMGYGLLRGTRLSRIPLPAGLRWGQFFWGLWVPGYAFTAHGNRRVGRWFMGVWLGLLAACLLGFGQAWSNVGFGLLVSAHATSILHLLGSWLHGVNLRTRLILSVAVVGALAFFVYLPLRRFMTAQVGFPVRTENGVIVIRPGDDPGSVGRGDWIAYRMASLQADGVRLEEGLGVAPILGMAGDRIEFAPNEIRVNGRVKPRSRWMPTEGEVIVPEDSWFVWPQVRMVVERHLAEGAIENILYQQAFVPRGQFIGRPYRWWLLRRQVLP